MTNLFTCVDGPEFDAHTVIFDVLAQRSLRLRREVEELHEFQEHAEERLREIRHACQLEAARSIDAYLRQNDGMTG